MVFGTTTPVSILRIGHSVRSKTRTPFDYIILISTDLETRVERVISRDATTREKVIERINNQMPDEIKQSKSDFVIYNNNDDKVIKQILFHHSSIKQYSFKTSIIWQNTENGSELV